MLFVLICLYVLVPLIELFTDPYSEDLPFPYKMAFPYNPHTGTNYAITYVVSSVAGFGAISTLFSEDSIFGFFVSHSCGRFRLLHLAIEQLAEERLNADKGVLKRRGLRMVFGNDDGGEMSRLLLRRIVIQHNIIIK